MSALSGREQWARRPILHGDTPDYADDYDGPDPVDGSYWPHGWTTERLALAADEHRNDRQQGVHDDREF